MTPHQGLGRYTVFDHLALFLMADEIGGNISEFPQTFTKEGGNSIVDLVRALGDAVGMISSRSSSFGRIRRSNRSATSSRWTLRSSAPRGRWTG
jgi:hypothetical protein